MERNEYVALVLFSADPRMPADERAIASAILDAVDMECAEEGEPTPEQRARFERRLDEEIARIRAERECQNTI